MTRKRALILVGMVAGLVWAIGLLILGMAIPLPIAMIQPALLGAAFPPGLFLLMVIGRLAQRRFLDDDTIDGALCRWFPRADRSACADEHGRANRAGALHLAVCGFHTWGRGAACPWSGVLCRAGGILDRISLVATAPGLRLCRHFLPDGGHRALDIWHVRSLICSHRERAAVTAARTHPDLGKHHDCCTNGA